jgi:hypothetical protein
MTMTMTMTAAGSAVLRFGAATALGPRQARYHDLAGKPHTVSQTFATRPEAARFLAQVEMDLARGEWTDPRWPGVAPHLPTQPSRCTGCRGLDRGAA